MADGERPHLRIVPAEADAIEVVDLSTGERVFRPDIAEKAMGIFGQAIEAAGGEFVVPDDISSLFSEDVRPASEEEI